MRDFMRTTSGQTREFADAELDAYFRLIEALTGLDRAIAECILRSGQTIDHPTREFFSDMGGPK
jgi:hypothetical protein